MWRGRSSFCSESIELTQSETHSPQVLLWVFPIQLHLALPVCVCVRVCVVDWVVLKHNIQRWCYFPLTQRLHHGSKSAAVSDIKKHAVIYWCPVMKHEASVACFLTLAARKYGCRELRWLGNTVTPPHGTGRIIREKKKQMEALIHLLFIYSPLRRRDKFPCRGFVSPSHDTTGCMRRRVRRPHTNVSTDTHTHTQTHTRLTSGLISNGRHHRCH